MKKIKTTIAYTIPHWNYCNTDNFDAFPSKPGCRFCIKTKEGYRCALYDTGLATKDGFIQKTRECCKATAGFASSVAEPQRPTIEPKDLMRQTIDLYNKYVNDLINQGYPKPMADRAARDYILNGGN